MELGPCAAHPPTPRLSDRAPSDPAARAARQAPLKRDQGSACASRQGYRQPRAPLKPGRAAPPRPSAAKRGGELGAQAMSAGGRVLQFPTSVAARPQDSGLLSRELSADELAGCWCFSDDDQRQIA